MTALTTDREDNVELNPSSTKLFNYPVDAGAVIFQGAIVCIDTADKLAKPGATSTTLVAVGIARDQADNTGGANEAISIEVKNGTFLFFNSAAADEIDMEDVGKVCFIVDDQTVALTNGGATRSAAGVIVDVEGAIATPGLVSVRMGADVQPA